MNGLQSLGQQCELRLDRRCLRPQRQRTCGSWRHRASPKGRPDQKGWRILPLVFQQRPCCQTDADVPVKTNYAKSLHVSCRVEIVRRDFVVQISIFSMPRCLGSESPSMLEIKNYRNPYKYVEGGKRTGTTTEQTFDRSLRDCCVFGF